MRLKLLRQWAGSCYIRAMKKSVVAVFLLALFAIPAFAATRKLHYPQAHHPENPYLKHLSHKQHRPHHKKV
jgi:hypothetical protein